MTNLNTSLLKNVTNANLRDEEPMPFAEKKERKWWVSSSFAEDNLH